jgi:hypothetical protein
MFVLRLGPIKEPGKIGTAPQIERTTPTSKFRDEAGPAHGGGIRSAELRHFEPEPPADLEDLLRSRRAAPTVPQRVSAEIDHPKRVAVPTVAGLSGATKARGTRPG